MTTICRVDDRVRTAVDTARKWALPFEPHPLLHDFLSRA